MLGCKKFRTQLSAFLTEQQGKAERPVNRDNLAVTNGASGSFSNILTFFTSSTTKFIIENPTYFLAIRVLEDHGISRDSTLKIPTDENGLCIDILEEALRSSPPVSPPPSTYGEKRFPYLLFLVPTFSNPNGVTLSMERRQKLVKLARKYDVLVVCDDVYHLLHFGTTPPPRLVSFDLDSDFGNVISNQSFSKIMGPGVRLGWVEGAKGIIDQYVKSGLMYSGGSPNHLTSGIMGSAIELGTLGQTLDLMRSVLNHRMNLMFNFLSSNLPKSVKIKKPLGGYFIWVELPKGHDTTEIFNGLRTGLYRGKPIPTPKVQFAPGNLFSSDASHGHCLRLTYAHYDDQQILVGLDRLKDVLTACLAIDQ
ncbi:pyridoxal phosphate-dependent transferase [Zopfochytrium polystomum]|nr:pyridoxal phosphate-dependent transferase [Zopfochytrium polystomum]